MRRIPADAVGLLLQSAGVYGIKLWEFQHNDVLG